jgi:hypothetical protein
MSVNTINQKPFTFKTNIMGLFTFFPLLIVFVYLAILAGIFLLIYTWVNRFITLRQEQNDLLREIIKKMDHSGKE